MEPLVSVIIPTLDEAETLVRALAALKSNKAAFETIVVDAQSHDETVKVAEAAGARVVFSSRRQRAGQSNLGACHARGEILLFLHADTLLPKGGLDEIAHGLRNRAVVGGAFARRYDSISPLLRITCLLAHLRNRLIGWHLGDQAMFVRKNIFFQLGGFRELDLFEDLDFSRRLKRLGRIVTLFPCVISSSRRFERKGAALTTWHDLGLTLRFLFHGRPGPIPRNKVAPISLS